MFPRPGRRGWKHPMIWGAMLIAVVFCSVNAHASSEVKLEHVEVTQGIQDEDNSVPLIAGRQTVVRAYFRLNTGSTLTLKGRLARTSETRDNEVLDEQREVTLDASRNGNIEAMRKDWHTSLNFDLPDSWRNEGPYDLKIIVDDQANTVSCSNCASKTQKVEFTAPTTLHIRLIKFQYTYTDGKLKKPSEEDVARVRSWLIRAYPIANLDISTFPLALKDQGSFIANPDCRIPNFQLSELRWDEVKQEPRKFHKNTRYIGLVSDAEGKVFMRGCAPGTMSRADIVASVPVGAKLPLSFGCSRGDQDHPYADWYAGHELSHSFGLEHVDGGCSEEGPIDRSPGLDRRGLIQGPSGKCHGLDMGDKSPLIERKILDGAKYHDVRTYADFSWLSAFTYSTILCELYDEDGDSDTWCERHITMDHPDLFPTGLTVILSRSVRASWRQRAIPETRSDSVLLGNPPPIRKDRNRKREKKIEGEESSEPLLGILASIEYNEVTEEVTGHIEFTQKLSRSIIYPDEIKQKVRIEFLGEDGTVIDQKAVALLERPAYWNKGWRIGTVEDTVILPSAPFSKLRLVWVEVDKQTGKETFKELDRKTIRSAKPVNEFEESKGGTSATQRAVENKDPVDIQWPPAKQPDPHNPVDITYTVRVSADGGATWNTVAVAYKHTMLTLSEDQLAEFKLAGATRFKVWVIASDGFNSTEIKRDVEVGR